MFAPEGYMSFSTLSDFLAKWAERVYVAHLTEQSGGDPAEVITDQREPLSPLMSFRLVELKKKSPELLSIRDTIDWDFELKQRRRDNFFISIIFHCLLSKALMKFDTLLVSPEGRVIEVDDYLFCHMDRLDWVFPIWPVEETGGLSNYMKFFEEDNFDGEDVSNRYYFLDFALGTIRLKNNSISSFLVSSHFGDDMTAKRYVKTHVKPFIGWAVVWNSETLPDNFMPFFEEAGLLEDSWDVPKNTDTESAENRPKRKRGAKPTGARAEFFRLYPDGKPDDLSADAIAAQLTEAGFPIGGRQIQNYAKEIKPK